MVDLRREGRSLVVVNGIDDDGDGDGGCLKVDVEETENQRRDLSMGSSMLSDGSVGVEIAVSLPFVFLLFCVCFLGG